jgi:GNAT superfamily N-acetyltransferase
MLTFHPLTSARWPDLEALFGAHGACGGCWCMWFRLPKATYEAGKGHVNRNRLRTLVKAGAPTGILAYDQGEPTGWCSIAPRSQHARLATTRTMHAATEGPLWSILCIFVAASRRGDGLSSALIREATRWAREQGAHAVEAFPVIPRRDAVPPVFASQGLLSAYLRCGFREVGRPSPSRAVVVWP